MPTTYSCSLTKKNDMTEANAESRLLRPPAVAGAWYPAEPVQLATAVDQYLAAVHRWASRCRRRSWHETWTATPASLC